MAALSILRTALAPQDVHLQRVLPALVLPFLAIFLPQTGHTAAAMANLAVPSNFFGRNSMS